MNGDYSVFELRATLIDPFTGRGELERGNTFLFATREGAERRVDRFKSEIRRRLKIDDDYPIEVVIVERTVIRS